jgi:hypothetical protein
VSWQFVALDQTGAPMGDLTDARSRKATWRLTDVCEAELAVSVDSPQQAFIDEGINDVAVYRNGSLLLRGRMIGSSIQNLAADQADMAVSIIDYRGLLKHRRLWSTSTAVASGYTSVDQAAIAWDLIADSQALTGGGWGITQGIGATTGVVRTRSVGYYTEGKNLAEAIDDLSKLSGGFDWEIDPLLAFNVYYPLRGGTQDFAISYDRSGGNVTALQRSVDLSGYANVVRVSGDTGTTASTQAATDLATRPEKRWELQEGDTDLKSTTAVSNRALRLLADASTIQPAYTATLAASAGWDPSVLWVGDTCPIRVRRGGFDIDTTGRVVELVADIGDDGEETISVTFDQPSLNLKLVRSIRDIAGRLGILERR